MGLFGMIGDVLGTLHDMKELGKIQDGIEEAVEGLISSDKCPDALKAAFEKVKGTSKDASQEEAMDTMKGFAKALHDHADSLPEEIRKKAGKYVDVVKDIEEKAADIAKLTKK